mgnify:CR=1 FL=1
MPHRNRVDPQLQSDRFTRFRNIQRLGHERSGHASVEHVRHQLYVARDQETRANALIKLTSKPGLIYEQNLANEITTLSAINRDLPESRHFPLLLDHGRLPDGRVFLVMSLFDEWPLATRIGPERVPDRLVSHLLVSLETASALAELHRIGIVHVDLNPMNILYRPQESRPVIRIVDFESSYHAERHAHGVFYNPPTTTGFSAPEVRDHTPDSRADVFSLGAVLYTMIAGYEWTWKGALWPHVEADAGVDEDLRRILLTAAQADRERRYRSIDAMRAALAGYLDAIWPGHSPAIRPGDSA